MSLTMSMVATIGLTILSVGVGLVLFPDANIVGTIISAVGGAFLLWLLIVYISARVIRNSYPKRLQINYVKADFASIGETSPSILLYLNIRNRFPYQFRITGRNIGDLRNPAERISRGIWRSMWELDKQYQDIISPNADTMIRILWYVPPSYHGGPMAEFAFRAVDTRIQYLAFDDMSLEIHTKFLGIGGITGWLRLLAGVVEVEVPHHIVFDRVRKEYNRARGRES